MDLTFSDSELAFQTEVRAWIAEAMPPHIKKKAQTNAHFEHAEIMEWHSVLYDKGWVAPDWPKEHGGTGWSASQSFLFNEEHATAGAPRLSPFGLRMVGPIIMQFGTDEHKARFLPPILAGRECWCQGYSEPNAGSDLASLKLRADSDGDHYVLNGQKTWTSHAQYADWIIILARTAPSKQGGITFLLVDTKSSGIEIKPFMNISGQTTFSEIFFNDVRVPKKNRIGEENDGWTIAKALLGHERTMIASVPESRRMLGVVESIAAETSIGDRRLLDDPGFRQKLASLRIRHRALEMTQLRVLASLQKGKPPGAESSVLKIRGSEIWQQVNELAMEAMGHNALGWFDSGDALPESQRWIASIYNYARAATIYGGSNEIQRNIIAKNILGLPSMVSKPEKRS